MIFDRLSYLEALNDAGDDLVLEPRVFALGVLSNYDNVHVLVAGGETGEVEAVDQGSVQVELFPQLDVERAHTPADWSLQAAFQADLVLPDRLDHLRRHPLQIAVDVVPLKVHRSVHRLHDLLDSVGDERAYAVAGDQGDGPRGSVAGSGHVGDGSCVRVGFGKEGSGRGAVGEVFEDREGPPSHWVRVRVLGFLEGGGVVGFGEGRVLAEELKLSWWLTDGGNRKMLVN